MIQGLPADTKLAGQLRFLFAGGGPLLPHVPMIDKREIFLRDHDWARSAEDVLWRRTKLGLRVSKEDSARLGAYMAGKASMICIVSPRLAIYIDI